MCGLVEFAKRYHIQHSPLCVCLFAQSCLILCDPMDCSPPGYSVCGILQARILEWVAMPFPGDLPNPGIEPVSLMFLHWQAGSLPLVAPGKPREKGRKGKRF